MENQKLHVLGKILESDKNAVAIVGSRQPSKKGEKAAYEFSYYLAAKGVTIVSGMARGIDSVAHKAALEAEGRTIAVLGSGVDVIYPPENKNLYDEIIKNGAVVSQFPMGTKPYAKNFLERNRIVAELALAVLVVEGARISGTLSIASWAGKLGREVFAIPGSGVTDYLISEGATIANSPMQILEYLNELNNS